jgi:hypothetical protein
MYCKSLRLSSATTNDLIQRNAARPLSWQGSEESKTSTRRLFGAFAINEARDIIRHTRRSLAIFSLQPTTNAAQRSIRLSPQAQVTSSGVDLLYAKLRRLLYE